MIRTYIERCHLPREEADALNRASGERYTQVAVFHWRTYRHTGHWLSQNGAEKWNDRATVGQPPRLHAHSVDAAQQGFYKACTTTRACRKAGLDTRYPYKRKKFRTTIWKKSGIRREGNTLPVFAGLDRAEALGQRLPQQQPARARTVLNWLQALPGIDGPFVQHYAIGGQAGRRYFTLENGQRIQAIRDMIATWTRQAVLTDVEEAWLLACLLEGADQVANTASVYAAFLKDVKRTAQRPLRLPLLMPTMSDVTGHQVWCEDVQTLVQRDHMARVPATLVYADPPYTNRQYCDYYHILETIARWDLATFVPRGKTGLRPLQEQRSLFSRQADVAAAFSAVLGHAAADWLLISYSSDGLLDKDTLEQILRQAGFTQQAFVRLPARRFRADRSGKRAYRQDDLEEWLVLGAATQRVSPLYHVRARSGVLT